MLWIVFSVFIILNIQLSEHKHDFLSAISKPTISTEFKDDIFPQHQIHKNVFKFTNKIYNVSIYENSVGKTFVKADKYDDKIGMSVLDGHTVKYKIVGGDKDKLFKAEERKVADFVFLTIRTRTSNVILNREKTNYYLLKIRAYLSSKNHANLYSSTETDTSVYIRVLDRNDLSPLFYPTEYYKNIPEDTPKHSKILKVLAEDADLEINGEIYYSFLDENSYFSIHPTTGEIKLCRSLNFFEQSRFEIIVIANDRGAGYSIQQTTKAKVVIMVEQVIYTTYKQIFFSASYF